MEGVRFVFHSIVPSFSVRSSDTLPTYTCPISISLERYHSQLQRLDLFSKCFNFVILALNDSQPSVWNAMNAMSATTTSCTSTRIPATAGTFTPASSASSRSGRSRSHSPFNWMWMLRSLRFDDFKLHFSRSFQQCLCCMFRSSFPKAVVNINCQQRQDHFCRL